MLDRNTFHLAVFLAAALLGGCGTEGGRGSSTVTVDVDGMQTQSSEQASGVDAAGNTFVLAKGTDWSLEVRFLGTSAGDFSSASTSGAQVTYTDANGNVYVASDALAGTAYTITVTTYDSSGIEGTFTTTVIGPGGDTHVISGTFKIVFLGVNSSNPYEGTYIGIFTVQGQVLEGTDPDTGDDIWGPLQKASFQVTVELRHLASGAGSAAYNVVHTTVSDGFFGCQVGGCTPCPLTSVAALPDPPGTPTPSGPSQAGHGFVIMFPTCDPDSSVAGPQLLTNNDADFLYTSTDGRTLSNTLGVDQSWVTKGGGNSDDYVTTRIGESYTSLNPDTRSSTWAMTKSAL